MIKTILIALVSIFSLSASADYMCVSAESEQYENILAGGKTFLAISADHMPASSVLYESDERYDLERSEDYKINLNEFRLRGYAENAHSSVMTSEAASALTFNDLMQHTSDSGRITLLIRAIPQDAVTDQATEDSDSIIISAPEEQKLSYTAEAIINTDNGISVSNLECIKVKAQF